MLKSTRFLGACGQRDTHPRFKRFGHFALIAIHLAHFKSHAQCFSHSNADGIRTTRCGFQRNFQLCIILLPYFTPQRKSVCRVTAIFQRVFRRPRQAHHTKSSTAAAAAGRSVPPAKSKRLPRPALKYRAALFLSARRRSAARFA